MNPSSILGRYLAKQVVVTFLLVLVTIMGIVMMFDAIEALRRISGRDGLCGGICCDAFAADDR